MRSAILFGKSFIFVPLLLACTAGLCADITVKLDGTEDYTTIQAAIDAAIDGDVVMLQPGTYTGLGNRDIDFKGKAITVRGATSDPADCVIDTQTSGNRRGFYFHSGENSSSRLEFLTITNGYDSGGAIYITYCSPTINRCIIDSNSAPYYGAGIYMQSSNSLISNCIMTDNQTSSYGGALYCSNGSPNIINCAFVDNASNYGDGTLYFQGGSPIIQNCTVNNNYSVHNDCAGIYLASSNCSIKNCIIWNNDIWFNEEAPQIYTTGSATPTVTYSCIQGGYTGQGNLSSNPSLLTYGGYHLRSDSICIERGDPSTTILPGETDIDGDPRILGRIDIGVDETIPQNQPVLYLPEKVFEFATGKHSAANTQTLKVSNYGTLPFDWYMENDCNWLIINQLSGQTEAQQTTDIVLHINNDNMDYGMYSCQFNVWADSAAYSPQTVTVNFAIVKPEIGLDKTGIYFTAYGKNDPNVADQQLTISNTSFDTLNWLITGADSCQWLTVFPENGQTSKLVPADISLSVNPAIPGYGVHSCELTISDPNASNNPQVVTVTLDVLGPEIAVLPESVSFECDVDEPNTLTQILSISNVGYDTLNWQIFEECAWLSVSPMSGQSMDETDEVTLTVDTVGIEIGTYNCELKITDDNTSNSPVTVLVSLHVYRDGERHVPMEYPTISDAVDAAVDGDHVIIHPGVYSGYGNNRISINGKAVTIRSIDPDNRGIVEKTVISGYGSQVYGIGFNDNESSASVVEGLVFQGFTSELIYCVNSSPTIRNCIFKNNYPYYRSTCVYLKNSSAVIENCEFVNNYLTHTKYLAGGICISNEELPNAQVMIQNCLISVCYNDSYYSVSTAPGVSVWGGSLDISNCTIAYNYTLSGDMYYNTSCPGIFIRQADVTINSSIVWGNEADDGSQIGIIISDPWNELADSRLLVSNSVIQGGQANILLFPDNDSFNQYASTQQLPDPNLIDPDVLTWGPGNIDVDPLFVRQPYDGGDGWFDNWDTPDINESDNNDYGDLHLKSQAGRFVWDGFAKADFNFDKRVDLIDFSVMAQAWGDSIAGGPPLLHPCNLDGDYNIDVDDLILLCEDYLQQRVFGAWVADNVTSPCIDSGDPNDAGWQNELWPHGGKINMGAYGGTAEASMSLKTTVGNIADFNNDGMVDFKDYSYMSETWQQNQTLLPEDIDRNNYVDILDFVLFATEWLWQSQP
jgi:pectin methylesterase-like acyl-CoA thioesterase